jgi:predicted DNA-binding protein
MPRKKKERPAGYRPNTISLVLEDELYGRVKEAARQDDRKLSTFVRRFLDQRLPRMNQASEAEPALAH